MNAHRPETGAGLDVVGRGVRHGAPKDGCMTSLKVDIVGIDTLGEAEWATWRAMLAAR